MPDEKPGLLFISCGQFHATEIKLGQDLAEVITDLTGFEGYFAQNQSSLDGLSQNILGALNRCCGFVAVIHQRGEVKTPNGGHIRASVWVEQEIAIAAFLQQAMQRNFAVAVYIQKGIKREGIREQLLLGAIEFQTEAEVLADLKTRIADGRFSPVRTPPVKDVAMRLEHQVLSRGAVHNYRLTLSTKNTGAERISDYWAEIQIPKSVFDGCRNIRIMEQESPTHAVCRTTKELVGLDLYPDAEIELMTIPYHMGVEQFREGNVLKEFVIAKFGSTGMSTKRIERPFRELQEY